MANLKTKIDYFLDLRGKITKGEWVSKFLDKEELNYYPHRGEYVIRINGGRPTSPESDAMSKIPQALDLIAELAKTLESKTKQIEKMLSHNANSKTFEEHSKAHEKSS
jgi:outer membrane protein assembly factor BamD (BamD/ComL family)